MPKDHKNYVTWNMQIPKALDEGVEKAVQSGIYATKVDFVRDSIRRRIQELKLLQYDIDACTEVEDSIEKAHRLKRLKDSLESYPGTKY